MARKSSLAALVVGLIVATSFVGAAAFTTATVERDVTVGIEADNESIIQLQPGTADGAKLNDNKQLVIAPDDTDPGLNQNATFYYGDNTSASDVKSSYGFNITNKDDAVHDFTLNYSQDSGAPGEVKFVVVRETGNTKNTVTKTNGKTITLQSSETAYVVVIVDSAAGTDNIQGTLIINAN